MPVIVVGGNEIAFTMQGEGDASMVFVHGIGTDASSWQALVQHFSKTYKCYTFDLKGFGESRINASNVSFRVDALAKDLGDILDKLNVQGTFYIIGDNTGALAALKADIDDRVKGKGIIAINAADKYKCKVKAKALVKGIDGSGLRMVDKMNLKERVEKKADLVDQWAKETGTVDFSSDSPYIETPVDFIVGKANSHVSVKDCEGSVGRIPKSRVTVVDGGDFPAVQCPDELAKEITDFVTAFIPSLEL